ncbi:Sulfate transporter 3.1 [Bienertia sinuspersici]
MRWVFEEEDRIKLSGEQSLHHVILDLGDQIRSDQTESDQIRPNQIRSDRIRSDQTEYFISDQIRLNQIRSDQIRQMTFQT